MTKMDAFQIYFGRTRLREFFPKDEELVALEDSCINQLAEWKDIDTQRYIVEYTRCVNNLYRRYFGKETLPEGRFLQRRVQESTLRLMNKLSKFDEISFSFVKKDALKKYKPQRVDKNKPQQVATSSKEQIVAKEEKPHFKYGELQFNGLALNRNQAERLYDNLFKGGYIEDTGKDGFVYFYIGKGTPPENYLKWIGKDRVVLSILMRVLTPPANRMNWQMLQKIYPELKVSGMKQVLSHSRGTKTVKAYYSYDSYEEMVKSWLTNGSQPNS